MKKILYLCMFSLLCIYSNLTIYCSEHHIDQLFFPTDQSLVSNVTHFVVTTAMIAGAGLLAGVCFASVSKSAKFFFTPKAEKYDTIKKRLCDDADDTDDLDDAVLSYEKRGMNVPKNHAAPDFTCTAANNKTLIDQNVFDAYWRTRAQYHIYHPLKWFIALSTYSGTMYCLHAALYPCRH